MTDFDHLLDLLRHNDPATRQQAIVALGELGDVRAIRPLIHALANDAHIATRAATLRALGSLGTSIPTAQDQVLPPLIDALQDPYPPNRSAAASLLGRLENPQAVPALLAALQNEAGPLRASATQALAQIGDPQVVPGLLAALDDERADVRYHAALGLGQFGAESGDPAVIPALIAALDDADSVFGEGMVCEAAAAALRATGSMEALDAVAQWERTWVGHHVTPDVDTLLADLNDAAWEIRHQTAEILGGLKEPRAVEALIGLLNDADPDVAEAAARALGQIGEPHAVEPLLAALEKHDAAHLRGCVDALGNLRDSRAVPHLVTLLARHEHDLDFRAILALEKIGTREAQNAVKRWQKSQEKNPRFPP